MLKHILHASSRLACRDIQRIQPIQRIQLYSYTRYTAYSTIQPPSGPHAPRPLSAGCHAQQLARVWSHEQDWDVRTLDS